MFNTAILDVAVGLVLIYLILAAACTSINEYIAQLLSLRAAMLWQGVKGLFQNSPKAEEFAKSLYDHDLIDALSPATQNSQPSYIPSHVFSLALVDRLGIHLPSQNASGQTLSVADLLAMSPVDPSIKKVVAPLAVAAGNDIDKFRQLVESWFDSAMQRVSGWYKKRIQLITLLVAAAVCLLINADTLSIADTLWSNPTVRTQLAGAAKSVGPLKVGQTAKPPGANVTNAASTIPTVDPSTLKQSESLAASLIGWHGPILPTMKGYDSNDVHRFPTGGEWVWKLVGILISAIAVSLGAPFWFDTLNRIMNIRGAGGSPVEAGAPQRIASSPTLSGIPVPASGAVDPSTGTQETKQP